jgi:hypothetical protein
MTEKSIRAAFRELADSVDERAPGEGDGRPPLPEPGKSP